jgi:hypothetical protein
MNCLRFLRGLRLAVVFLPLSITGAASAATIVDFESLSQGEVVTDQLLATHGVVVSAVNFAHRYDLAVAFDTRVPSAVDPDLNGPPWAGGNIVNEDLGKALILSQIDETAPGFTLPPDDLAARPAGDLILTFDRGYGQIGFDQVDLDSVVAEKGSVEFLLAGASVGSIGWEEFIDPTSAHYDPTISFGDRHANRIDPIVIAALGGADLADQVIFHMGGSGAIDNVVLGPPTEVPIPEPGAAVVFGLGALLVFARRRR